MTRSEGHICARVRAATSTPLRRLLDLRREIEEAFSNAASSVHQALEVRVENPISEYRVISLLLTRPGKPAR